MIAHVCSSSHFNPRSPCGERLFLLNLPALNAKFQSTLPVWGATTTGGRPLPRPDISIHAPRVGSDAITRAPGGTRDDFNPRSPCGERRQACGPGVSPAAISIHAPRVGSDLHIREAVRPGRIFQSTLPVWGATPGGGPEARRDPISIHAPRVGSDRYA